MVTVVEGYTRTLHGVLDRSTREEEPISAVEAEQCLPTITRGVLDVLRLI